VAAGGNFCDRRGPVLAFNLANCPRHDVVHARLREPLDEKSLERSDVLVGRRRRRIFRNELAERLS
jgi:hypothetical protein